MRFVDSVADVNAFVVFFLRQAGGDVLGIENHGGGRGLLSQVFAKELQEPDSSLEQRSGARSCPKKTKSVQQIVAVDDVLHHIHSLPGGNAAGLLRL